MELDVFSEINCCQRNFTGERICGDVFLTRKLKEDNRILVVMSDGMGHGVKANILATLTSTMALNFMAEHKNVYHIAEIIMKTLPVCDVRKSSYATFTIIDIESDGKVTILEFDNPSMLFFRGAECMKICWEELKLEKGIHKDKIIRTTSLFTTCEDRLIFFSDGVTQSGLGSELFPMGWGDDKAKDFIFRHLKSDCSISAADLTMRVVNKAYKNDGYNLKDDVSCGCIYFRKRKRLLICSGPPFNDTKDVELGNRVKAFEGPKIIMGATTAAILSRELEVEIEDAKGHIDSELPFISFMKGFDLVTEGILTLSAVERLLILGNKKYELGDGAAEQVVKFIFDSDEIHFLIGTGINIAHQNPELPVELEIRKTVVKRISVLLEDKYMKITYLHYI